MKKVIIIIFLFLASQCFATVGDTEFGGNVLPDTTTTFDLGSSSLKWDDVFAVAYNGDGSALTGIGSGTGGVINTGSTTIGADSDANGTGVIVLQIGGATMFEVTNDGNIAITQTITSGTWEGSAIDISSYTNLVAGTNITLSGDTLNVDDAFLINSGNDTTTGILTTAGLTITTGNALTLGVVQWDDGSDKIEGNILADDSVDDDALDFTSITLASFTADIATTDLTDTANVMYKGDFDTFSELQTQIADKTLVNEEDAATIDSAWTFSGGITGAVTGNVTGDLTGNADTATNLETTRFFSVSGDVVTASGVAFSGGANVELPVSFASEVIVNNDISPTAAISADKLTDGSTNAIPTLTQETNWDTHLSSDGSGHSFIDQDVTSGSSPNFDNTNMTGNISVWTNDSGYITSTLSTEQVQDITGGMVTGNTEVLIAVTYQDGDGTLDFVVDEAGIDHDALTNFDPSEHYLQGAITQTGIVVTGWWNASPIDISDYTNLIAGTNITLTNDTLSVDNPIVADLTGDVTGNADTATNVVDNDFGDVNVVGGAWIVETVAGAEVILGIGTTGNYVATIADDGNSTVTVSGSGSETAAVTLLVIDDGHAHTGTSTTGFIHDDADDQMSGKLTITKTTQQLELEYDGSNQLDITVDSGGDATITASGGDISFGDETITTTGPGRFDSGIGVGVGPTVPHWIHIEKSTMNKMGIMLDATGLNPGDPIIEFALRGTSKFILGVDDSNNDDFKISAGDALGTNDVLVIDSNGNTVIGGTITGGAYNTLHIVPGTGGTGFQWVNLSGDGTERDGLSISIPYTAGNDFLYGWDGTEHHYFGNTAQVEITDDGKIIALSYNAITLAVNDLVIDDAANNNSLTVSGDRLLDQDVNSGASPTFDGTNFTGIPSAGVTNNVSATANLTDHNIVRGHGGAKVVQTTGITVDDSDNVSGVGTLGCGAITATGLVVDTPTLAVDAVNHRVGIGLTDPSYAFHIAGKSNDRFYASSSANTCSFQLNAGGFSWSNMVFTRQGAGPWSVGQDNSHFRIAYADGFGANLFFSILNGGNVGISETDPQDKLEVNGTVLVKDKLKFTQDDGNEYIDSLNDGYMDYGATTGHRFNANVDVTGGIKSSGGRIFNETRYTTTQTLDNTDHIVSANTDGGAWTLSLPAGVVGTEYEITNTGSSGNNLTIAPNGAEDLIGINANWTLFDGETLKVIYRTTDGWY